MEGSEQFRERDGQRDHLAYCHDLGRAVVFLFYSRLSE
jgi:hypothetical protein